MKKIDYLLLMFMGLMTQFMKAWIVVNYKNMMKEQADLMFTTAEEFAAKLNREVDEL